jgi:hypothetical protein
MEQQGEHGRSATRVPCADRGPTGNFGSSGCVGWRVSRQKGQLATPAMVATALALSYEAFSLLGAEPLRVIDDGTYRVTLGVGNPVVSHLLGGVFLLAAVAVLLAVAGRLVGARCWKPVATGAWSVGLLAIIVTLSRSLWLLGHATVEPSFPFFGWPFAVAVDTDYFVHVALLAWLGFSGSGIALTPSWPHPPGRARTSSTRSIALGWSITAPASALDVRVLPSGWVDHVQPLIPGLLMAFLAPWARRPGVGVLMGAAAIVVLAMGFRAVSRRALKRDSRNRRQASETDSSAASGQNRAQHLNPVPR